MANHEVSVVGDALVKAEQVPARLAEMSVHETPTSLRTKISQDAFSAVLFVQCLREVSAKSFVSISIINGYL